MAVESEAGIAPAAPRPRRRLRLDLRTPSLLGLPLGWLLVFFLVPIGIVAAYSVDVYSIYPGPHPLTLSGWRDLLHNSVYLSLFWKSVKMSLIVSAIVVLLAYPLAYYLALSGTKRKYVLLLILIAPFLTSYLLRVLAWKVILGSQGVVNTFLVWIGLRSAGQRVESAHAVDIHAAVVVRLRRLDAHRHTADGVTAGVAGSIGCVTRLTAHVDGEHGIPLQGPAEIVERPALVAAVAVIEHETGLA